MGLIKKLLDLQKQAAVERSHFYVASCITEAIQEIVSLREITQVQFDNDGFQVCPVCEQQIHGPVIEIIGKKEGPCILTTAR